MSRDFQLPGRSPVIACDGMAATSHPLATLTAIETLRAGGNAADAAVAAVAALCVVEPQMTGIGGDCFCMIAEPGKPVWGYNGSGRAGARASIEALIGQGAIASGLDPCRHRAGRGRRLGGDPVGAWPLRARPRACPRDPLCRGRISGRRPDRLGLGAKGRGAARRSGRRAPFPVRRAGTGRRRRRAPAGTRADAAGRSRKKGRAPSTKGRSPTTWWRPSAPAAHSSPPRTSPRIAATWWSRLRPIIAASMSSNCRPMDRA